MNKLNKKTVSIIGGSGFVGKYLANSLLKQDYHVNIISRNAEQAKKNITMFKLGQFRQINCNIKNRSRLSQVLANSNIIVNLVGLLDEKRGNTFEDAHVEGVQNIVSISKELNIEKIIHLSAIGAKKTSLSKYAKTKFRGEEVIKKFENYNIIRPSIVYGDEDNFINFFAKTSKISPFLPLIGNGVTKFQPIWVQDLVNIILYTLKSDFKKNSIIEVGGEEIISFKSIIELILQEIELKRILINIPFSLAYKMAYLTELLPNPPLTRDQVEMLKKDNVVSKKHDYRKCIEYVPQQFKIMISKQLISYKKSGGHFLN